MAGHFGLDVDRFLNERDPVKKAITFAVIEQADRYRSNWLKELAGRTISNLAKALGGKGR